MLLLAIKSFGNFVMKKQLGHGADCLQPLSRLDFPQAQTVAEIPDIDWSRYGVTLPPERPANTSANNSDR